MMSFVSFFSTLFPLSSFHLLWVLLLLWVASSWVHWTMMLSVYTTSKRLTKWMCWRQCHAPGTHDGLSQGPFRSPQLQTLFYYMLPSNSSYNVLSNASLNYLVIIWIIVTFFRCIKCLITFLLLPSGISWHFLRVVLPVTCLMEQAMHWSIILSEGANLALSQDLILQCEQSQTTVFFSSWSMG